MRLICPNISVHEGEQQEPEGQEGERDRRYGIDCVSHTMAGIGLPTPQRWLCLHRPVHTLDVIQNYVNWDDKSFDHPLMGYTDVREIMEDYIDNADPDTTSFVFTVVRVVPKDWVVVMVTGEDMEVFGPFLENMLAEHCSTLECEWTYEFDSNEVLQFKPRVVLELWSARARPMWIASSTSIVTLPVIGECESHNMGGRGACPRDHSCLDCAPNGVPSPTKMTEV